MSDTRTARCACEQLTVTVTGEPARLLVCHCPYCQRKSGSVNQASAWFTKDQLIEESGQYRTYQGPDNPGIEYRFCGDCGSTVYWYFHALESGFSRQIYGIAVGCFNDPEFPPPEIEIHTGNRSDWVVAQPSADSFHGLPPIERLLPDEAEAHPFRSEPRIESRGHATLQVIQTENEELLNYEFQAEIYEVSINGLRISCDIMLEEGVLDVWVTLNGNDKRLHLSAEVRWCSWSEADDYEIGLEIIDNPISDFDDWCRLVAELPELI